MKKFNSSYAYFFAIGMSFAMWSQAPSGALADLPGLFNNPCPAVGVSVDANGKPCDPIHAKPNLFSNVKLGELPKADSSLNRVPDIKVQGTMNFKPSTGSSSASAPLETENSHIDALIPEEPLPQLPIFERQYTNGAKDPKSSEQILTASDLNNANIKLAYKGVNATLDGTIPSACAEHLAMDVVHHAVNDSDGDDIDDSEDDSSSRKTKHTVSSSNSSDSDASQVGVRVIYKPYEGHKSLAECMDAERDEALNSLSSLDKLTKPALDSNSEFALMGIMDASGKITLGSKAIKSPAYRKYLLAKKKSNCENCNASADRTQKILDGMDGLPTDLVGDLKVDAIQTGLDHQKKLMGEATSLRGLKSVRDELAKYEHLIVQLPRDSDSRDKMMNALNDMYEELQNQTGALAHKDSNHAGKYADFIADTATARSRLGGFDEDSRKTQRGIAEAYHAQGANSARFNFLLSVNQNDSEVRSYMNKEFNNANALVAQAQAACSRSPNSQNCIQARQVADNAAKQFMDVQKMVQAVQTQNGTSTTSQQYVASSGQNLAQPANGMPPGYFASASNGQRISINGSSVNPSNSVYSLSQNGVPIQNNANMYSLVPQNFTAAANSQYQLTNPAATFPAVPLNMQNNAALLNAASVVPSSSSSIEIYGSKS